ncbi:MAG: hypothetical protein Tsb0018_09190 [Opitutales bacterium]|tara:strand:+ start:1518 stop:1832 length:315 start_codon:yes stop_codon:yes gene_type:complete
MTTLFKKNVTRATNMAPNFGGGGGGVNQIFNTMNPQIAAINGYMQSFLDPSTGGVSGSGFDATNPNNVLMLQLITERLSVQTGAASSSMSSLFNTASRVIQNIS